jgi:hypothetical protein
MLKAVGAGAELDAEPAAVPQLEQKPAAAGNLVPHEWQNFTDVESFMCLSPDFIDVPSN